MRREGGGRKGLIAWVYMDPRWVRKGWQRWLWQAGRCSQASIEASRRGMKGEWEATTGTTANKGQQTWRISSVSSMEHADPKKCP